MIEFSGIAFRHVDNRVMSLRLVQLGLTNAAMFSARGEVLQPSEVLYKKPILVERGSFRPPTHVNMDMLRAAHAKFSQEPGVDADQIVTLAEITMCRLRDNGQVDLRFSGSGGRSGGLRFDGVDLGLFRILPPGGLLCPTQQTEDCHHHGGGQSVRTVRRQVLRRGWRDPGIVWAAVQERFEAHIYPLLNQATGELTTVDNVQVAPEIRKLYEYLRDKGCIEQLEAYDPQHLRTFSREVLKQIQAGDMTWTEHGGSGGGTDPAARLIWLPAAQTRSRGR